MIQRYDVLHGDEYSQVVEKDPQGDYVLFSDHESDKAAALAALKGEVERLKKRIADLEAELNAAASIETNEIAKMLGPEIKAVMNRLAAREKQ